MQSIDLNSDLGESFGRYSLGNDDQIIKLVSSVNVACGFHAGDPDVMAQTVAKAQVSGTAIGAHPSYPDRQGFGRRFMAMTPDEVKHLVIYQIGALKAFTKNGCLHHVKPHGALYNRAAKDHELALAICQGIQSVDPRLPIYGLAGSQLIKAAQEIGLPYAQEAFADRNYEADGSLVARSHENAVITDPDLIAKRVLKLIQTESLQTIDGSILNLKADSICVHGDNKAALEIVEKIRSVLSEANIQIKSF
ncbi:LamB/YcsF family protein [Oenococcus kitaharae]|uniref:5-oxoprolinase subunit A n=1 Tax=Oenococcus kitaharae DSM 17330 TaxID=1045004 RepID=G9WFM7_9LACO|nr:5-oxoprolinase subunit PxpA [Oenococcus kitaharae]EHN59319.1 LamB-like lactam utilization protein [Oenococcus kitaharae DSM 17330]OEY82161.1 LamB/YcsF family protein [Oenococcus kitaharae]OEY82584.1 LamB/YcsF family protein [Oenococcus kitaharae]OEY84840.1 LamB/YcsF family protein [Oenococcus kitaharae]